MWTDKKRDFVRVNPKPLMTGVSVSVVDEKIC